MHFPYGSRGIVHTHLHFPYGSHRGGRRYGWPDGLRGKWIAATHGWTHRGAGEAWTAGTERERAAWANATIDAMARQ